MIGGWEVFLCKGFWNKWRVRAGRHGDDGRSTYGWLTLVAGIELMQE